MPPPKSRKIAVMGSRSVGKSSLTVQFVEGQFGTLFSFEKVILLIFLSRNYYPTIENTFNKTIRFRGQEYATEIIDTAGQDEYSILNSNYSIGIHGFILVYSVASKSSFDMVKIIRDKILNHTGTEQVPIVIVGNKSDLHIQRQVTPEDGKSLALKWGCSWTEASARHNENVARIFDFIILEIEKQINPSQSSENKGCKIS